MKLFQSTVRIHESHAFLTSYKQSQFGKNSCSSLNDIVCALLLLFALCLAWGYPFFFRFCPTLPSLRAGNVKYRVIHCKGRVPGCYGYLLLIALFAVWYIPSNQLVTS